MIGNGTNSGVARVFEMPGRIRCAVAGLQGRAREAALIESAVRGVAGVVSADASPVTGRVLVIFDETVAPEIIHESVARASEAHLPARPIEVDAEPVPQGRPAIRYAIGAAAAIGLGAAMGGAGGALAAGLAAAAAFLGPNLWRRIRQWWLDRRAGGVLPSNVIRMPSRISRTGILQFAQPHRQGFFRSIAWAAAAALAGVLRIAAMAFTVDLLLGGAVALPFGMVLAGGAGAAALMGATLGLTYLQGWLRHRSHIAWSFAGRRIQHDLRVALYDRVQRLEMRTLDLHKRGDLLATLVEDIDNLEKVVESSWSLMDLAVSSVSLLIAIGAIAPAGPFWLMLPVPLLVGLSVYLYPKLRERYAAARRRSANLAGQISNQLDGVEIIKSFAAEDAELERLSDTSRAYLEASREAIEMQSRLPLLLEGTILASLVLTYRTNFMLTLGRGLSLGRFQAMNIFTGHLLFPLNTLGLHLDNLGQGLEALRRVTDTLEIPHEFRKDAGLPELDTQSLTGDVEYDGVTFAYPTSSMRVFGDLSLRFRGGQTTAVVGLSGSGKTTLIKLLLRLYNPDSGAITVGGADIAGVSRASLRRSIAVVSQDVYLFDRSILENIRLARPEATEEEVADAARIAQAHDFILRLPQGYQTRLGERGKTLSTGERQRIAIARAILRDAPIFILDEATANLDSNTEADISRELRRIAAGRTLILIAHRLATVVHADHIYALEHGAVIAEGRHEELVGRPGRYQALWRDQTGQS